MNQSQFATLKEWFDRYVEPFCETDTDSLRNIHLKIDHTYRVCAVMRQLVEGEGLSPEEGLIAETTALLHDVGRFPQYRRWRTFRDSESDNHARLSIEVIREQNILVMLDPEERLIIEEAVRFHNLLSIPKRLKSPTSKFLRLIRDADKLDIWHVFLGYFKTPEHERASATMLGLTDLPGVSPVCLEQLAAGRIVRLDTVACINDFKLLLISWIYDLNFSSSYRLADSEGFIHDLSLLLPEQEGITAAVRSAREYCTLKMTGFSS